LYSIPDNNEEELDIDRIREIVKMKQKNKSSDSSCNATHGSHEIAEEYENQEEDVEEEEDQKEFVVKEENKLNTQLLDVDHKVKEMKSITHINPFISGNQKNNIRASTIMGGTLNEEFKMRTERAIKKIEEAIGFLKNGDKVKALKASVEVFV